MHDIHTNGIGGNPSGVVANVQNCRKQVQTTAVLLL